MTQQQVKSLKWSVSTKMVVDILKQQAGLNRVLELSNSLYSEIEELVKVTRQSGSAFTDNEYRFMLVNTVVSALLNRASVTCQADTLQTVLFNAMKEKKENDRHSDLGHSNQEFGEAASEQ